MIRSARLRGVFPAWTCFGALAFVSASTSAAGGASAAQAAASEPEGPSRTLKIGSISAVGLEQVSERQVMDALASEELSAGATLLWPEDARVERARARLISTGYFARVTLRLVPDPKDMASVTLVVDVEERASLTVSELFLGSSLMTPFHGGIQLVERNFLGRAIHVGGGLIWGTPPRQIAKARRQQGLRLSIEAPRIPEARFGLAGTVYVLSASEPYRVAGAPGDPDPRLFRALDYSRVGGIVGGTFPITTSLRLAVDYRFERIDTQAPEGVDLALNGGISRLTTAGLSLDWDGREQAAQLGKGGRFGLDIHVSSPMIGSEYEYVRVVGGGAYTFRLPWRHWITPSVLGGQISGSAPRFELFYGGDLSDLAPGREMGLIYSTRSAFDLLGTGIAGRAFGVLFFRGDLEYVWPLFRRGLPRGLLGGHVFVSSGVYSLLGDAAERAGWRSIGARAAPLGLNLGLGLRLETALGTIELSVGNATRRLPL
ncbi:MAG: BamA/TamA family outer membrane protein [Nannocystis sp.]|nr:BamA/TamA family outer membrane protein [Nannocystis sp.]